MVSLWLLPAPRGHIPAASNGPPMRQPNCEPVPRPRLGDPEVSSGSCRAQPWCCSCHRGGFLTVVGVGTSSQKALFLMSGDRKGRRVGRCTPHRRSHRPMICRSSRERRPRALAVYAQIDSNVRLGTARMPGHFRRRESEGSQTGRRRRRGRKLEGGEAGERQ
jgi:hypothetical protein